MWYSNLLFFVWAMILSTMLWGNNIHYRSKEPNSKLKIGFIFFIYLAPNVIVRTTVCTATISLGLPKFTKPCIYYIRYISPWCTLFCEQKLYIASDCAVSWAKTSENPPQKQWRRGAKTMIDLTTGHKNTWYIAQCWARKEGYKRAPWCLGQHYPAWPYPAQCNQCVPAYLVWAVFRDLASFRRRLRLLENTKVSKSVSNITLQGSTIF
jgi:hypothetical protein